MSRKNRVEIEQRPTPDVAVTDAAVVAEEGTRRQIGQALHDDLQQHLYSIRTHIELARKRFETGAADLDVLDVLVDLLGRTDEALDVVRRVSRGLASSFDDVDGLHDGLQRLARQVDALHQLRVEIQTGGPAAEPEDPRLVGVLLNVTRELLFNVAKHAGTDRASVEVDEAESEVVLRVVDGGTGFDESRLRSPDEQGRGLGLLTARDRLASVGGSLDVTTEPGQGTTATIRVPRHEGLSQGGLRSSSQPLRS